MEKEGDSKEKNKGKFIIRTSADLDVESIINFEPDNDKEYSDLVLQTVGLVFEQLVEMNKNKNVDTVGVWITLDTGQIIDNSIELSILEDMKKYGSEDVEPIKEFFKMTI